MSDPRASRAEMAGVVFACGTAYGYTAPQSSGSIERFRLQVRIPRGATLAGTFHTHMRRAGEPPQNRFSRDDVRQQVALGVPSYIADARSREIRVLRGELSSMGVQSGERVSQ